MNTIQKFTAGMLYGQPATVDLENLRPRLIQLGRQILGDFADESAAIRAASSTRCWCGLGCTFRCLYTAPRHVGDAVSVFQWPANSMANAQLAAAVGNAVDSRTFDTHLDIGSGGGRTFVELGKVAKSCRHIAVEPNDAHCELLSVVVPGAEIYSDIRAVQPMRGSRCLVSLAGVLNCASSADVTEFVKTIATLGTGSVVATLDFIRAPGRLFEFDSKLKNAFGDTIRLIEYREDDRNMVSVWLVTR